MKTPELTIHIRESNYLRNQTKQNKRDEPNLVMQSGTLLLALEVHGSLEVLLHHIYEPIVILHRTSWILDQQRPGFSQYPTHFLAQPDNFGSGLLRRRISVQKRQIFFQIDHRQLHSVKNIYQKVFFFFWVREFGMAGEKVSELGFFFAFLVLLCLRI